MDAAVNKGDGAVPLSSHSRGICGSLVNRGARGSQAHWEVPKCFPIHSCKARSTGSGEQQHVLLVTSGPPLLQASLHGTSHQAAAGKQGARERRKGKGPVERGCVPEDGQWSCNPGPTTPVPRQFGNWLSSLPWNREKKEICRGKGVSGQ